MKIDIFTHILPTGYQEELYKVYGSPGLRKAVDSTPGLFDLNMRFRMLDQYGCRQVLTLGGAPPVEAIADPAVAADLARVANDEMSALVDKYPDRFAAAVATLPMNDMDAALLELDRAVHDLKMRGIQICSSIKGRPLDSPELFPLYERMVHYDLPIWIHPARGIKTADYPDEKISKYEVWSIFGWPYETTVAMTRLIFGGVFEKYPSLKVITHHGGGMVPYFGERIRSANDLIAMRQKVSAPEGLKKPPLEYYRMFYNDTALSGSLPALTCAYQFFGPDRLLFGSDAPFDTEQGARLIRQTIEAIEAMDIPAQDKDKIFRENAVKLLHLHV